ncbi:MAG: beta-lactamase family protein [Anaerolineales bacterium]|nr:beta-lactamase family protein [Anaerolineales bacterium]
MQPNPKLDAVLEEIAARWGVPGLAVGIVEHGEIVYARGIGVQSIETQTPVTPDSFFCLASIGKCFVASAILQLVEQGKLELGAPLCQYLPYFRLDDERYRQITLRQALSHTSGMPDMDELEYDELVSHPEYDEGAAERFVRAQASRKMLAAPGERFAYSNIAYNVLGDLIAKICGQTFEAAMQEHILRPAGMPDSTFYPPEVPPERLVAPHLRAPQMIVNPLHPYHRADAPSSFLYSTAVEMCHWVITCLNRGSYQGQRILSPASYALMWTPVAQRGVPPYRETMGLGWTFGHFDGVSTVSHGGGGFGWTCFLVLLPEKDCGAIVLCNEESTAHEWALEAVMRVMLGQEPQPGTLSWMVPIAQALHTGGIAAAYARYEQIKGSEDYYFDVYELTPLYYQLMSLKKFDLAREVLELNLYAYPESIGVHISLARHHLHLNDRARAEAILHQALAISPAHQAVTDLLDEIRGAAAADQSNACG